MSVNLIPRHDTSAWGALALALLVATAPHAGESGGISVRGCYGKDSSPSGFDHIVQTGFGVIDRAAYPADLEALPSGVKGLVWLGGYDNDHCVWEHSNQWIRSRVRAIAQHPVIVAYYLADEPHVWDCPSAPAQLKKRSTLVKSLDPLHPTFAVIRPHSPGNPYAPYVGTVDILGVDVYPCSHRHGCVMSKIDDAVSLAEQAGVRRYWGILQAFGDSWYRMPTADELHEQFGRWRRTRMEGYLVFSWAWRADGLENHPELREALEAENHVGSRRRGLTHTQARLPRLQ